MVTPVWRTVTRLGGSRVNRGLADDNGEPPASERSFVRSFVAARTRIAVTAVVSAAVLVPLVAVTTPAASAACATRTNRSISGVVYGADNLDVNVSIGFDVQASNGTIVDATPGSSTYGCKKTGGYSVKQHEKNRYLNAEGAVHGTKMYDYRGMYMGTTVRTWSLGNLPSNATSVWIEVYSRRYRNSGCADANGTPCMGPSDTHKYGHVMRRKVRIGSTGVVLKLPKNCAYRGTNGSITGTVKSRSGAALTPTRVNAWSMAPDSNTTPLGWGSGARSSGRYTISSLAANQKYAVWVSYGGVTQKRTYVPVASCKATSLSFVF